MSLLNLIRHKKTRNIKSLKTVMLVIGLLVFTSSCVIHKGFQICFSKACVLGPMMNKIKIAKRNANAKIVVAKRKLTKKKHHEEEYAVARGKKRKTTKESNAVVVNENKREPKAMHVIEVDSAFAVKDTTNQIARKDTLLESRKPLWIYYPNDGASISGDDKTNIKNYLLSFSLKKIKKVTIIGYTDNEGSSEHNKKLSFNRAKIINDYFIELGVEQFTLLYLGLAEENPASSNDNPEGRKLNRRTEIAIE